MVVACISLFVALGSTAVAAVVVSSNSQVAPNTISGHKPPSGKHANIIAGSINRQDVATNSLETCSPHPLIFKFGRLCEGSDGQAREWEDAANYCESHGLRLPTLGEARTLSRYDIDGVEVGDYFWTDDVYTEGSSVRAVIVRKGGSIGVTVAGIGLTNKTVCVAIPTA
jgi:hypothetical protein